MRAVCASMLAVVGIALTTPSLAQEPLLPSSPPCRPSLFHPHRHRHPPTTPLPVTPVPSLLVQVHVDGSNDLAITRVTPLGWWTVCTGACDTPLPADGLYRVVGGSMRPSAPFTLRADPGQGETVRVHGASEPLYVLGMFAVIGGGLVASYTWEAGAALAGCVLGTRRHAVDTGWESRPGLHGGNRQRGPHHAFLVSGTIALLGTVLVATNAKTTIDQIFPAAVLPAASPCRPTHPSRGVAAYAPSWKERLGHPAGRRDLPMMDLPIMQGRF